jgi:hypothetical protein
VLTIEFLVRHSASVFSNTEFQGRNTDFGQEKNSWSAPAEIRSTQTDIFIRVIWTCSTSIWAGLRLFSWFTWVPSCCWWTASLLLNPRLAVLHTSPHRHPGPRMSALLSFPQRPHGLLVPGLSYRPHDCWHSTTGEKMYLNEIKREHQIELVKYILSYCIVEQLVINRKNNISENDSR